MATETIGQRMTPQRKILLDVIRDAGDHLGADELFQRAKERDPRISLSTVYRNLNLLKELGLVAERHLAEEHHHYEINLSPHHHLICLKCGRVYEFESSLSDQIKRNVARESQFQVTNIEINMQGYCADCKRYI